MTRKFLLIVLAMVFLTGLGGAIGCGNSTTTSGPAETPSPEANKPSLDFLEVGGFYRTETALIDGTYEELDFKVLEVVNDRWVLVELRRYDQPAGVWLNTSQLVFIERTPPWQ